MMADEKVDIQLARYLSYSIKEFASWILNVELYPYQTLLLNFIKEKNYPMIVMTRGGSKTFCLAIFAAYYATMHPGQTVIYVAPSFRQVKALFRYLRQFYDQSPLLREAANFRYPIIYPDLADFRLGTSRICGFPLGDGTTIRGERGHCLLVDEFASIPIEVFEVVVAGFGVVHSNPREREERLSLRQKLLEKGRIEELDALENIEENKLVISGTSYYAYNHFFKYFKRYEEIVSQGSQLGILTVDPSDYGIFLLSHELIPKSLLSEKMVEHLRANMSKDRFDMEYGCVWKEDSAGFFPMSRLDSSTEPGDDPHSKRVQMSGIQGHVYVMGVDPAPAESMGSDNFAISVLDVDVDKWEATLVYVWAGRGKTWADYVSQTRKVLRAFTPVYLVIETEGGGTTLRQLLQDPKYVEDPVSDALILDRPEYDETKGLDGRTGWKILEMYHPGKVAALNHAAKSDLDHNVLRFAAPTSSDTWNQLNALKTQLKENKLSDEEVDKKIMQIGDDLDLINQEIQATKLEISLIHVSSTRSGQEHFDIDPDLKHIQTDDRPRKDRYSSWLMATHAFHQYMVRLKETKDEFHEDTPIFMWMG